jgi:hypothetical protein
MRSFPIHGLNCSSSVRRDTAVPWINDRIHPWRPFVYVPRAWEIDALIQKVLGREMFARITLK